MSKYNRSAYDSPKDMPGLRFTSPPPDDFVDAVATWHELMRRVFFCKRDERASWLWENGTTTEVKEFLKSTVPLPAEFLDYPEFSSKKRKAKNE